MAERSASQAASYPVYLRTTGKPKCVVLNNRATTNVVHQTQQRWAVTADDVFISVTPPHHDMTMFDLFRFAAPAPRWYLPAPHQKRDARQLEPAGGKAPVTLWCSVPAILEMLLTRKTADSHVRCARVAQGGETTSRRRCKPCAPCARIRAVLARRPTGNHHLGIGARSPRRRAHVLRPPAAGQPLPAGRRRHTARPAWSAAFAYRRGQPVGLSGAGELKQHDFVTLEGAGRATAARFPHRRSGLLRADGNIMFATRVNGCVNPRRARLVAGNRRCAAPPSGDPGYGGGGLSQWENNEAALGALYP
ncbi:AMP-binding protein [Serratia ureilytica]